MTRERKSRGGHQNRGCTNNCVTGHL